MLFFPRSKKLTFFSIIIGLFVVTLLLPNPIQAEEAPTEKLKDANEELEKIDKKIEEKQEDIKETEQQISVDSSHVNTLERKSRSLETNIKSGEERITEVLSEIKVIKSEIAHKNRVIEEQKRILAHLLRAQYNTIVTQQGFSELFPSGSNYTLTDNQKEITKKLGELTNMITLERAQLATDEETLASKRSEIETLNNKLRNENATIESVKVQRELSLVEARNEREELADDVEKLKEERIEIQKEIEDLSTAFEGSLDAYDIPDNAEYARPVARPYVITQGYGRTSFSYNYSSGAHNGVDYVAQGNQTVVSITGGTVLAVGNMGRYGYGKWVAVDHHNGLVSLYGHLSSVSVVKGQTVRRKSGLGIMGTTGFSTGKHVHLSIFVKNTFQIVASRSVRGVYIPVGSTVNPAKYLLSSGS